MRWRLLAAASLLLLAQPLGAFDLADVPRAVSVTVVADDQAYNAVSGGSCTAVPLSGGTCSFTITNKATTAQTYTVTLESDDGDVATYGFDGEGTVSSGPVSTASEIAVAASVTFTANLADCASCGGLTHHAYWTIEGRKPYVIDTQQTRFKMTITYTS